MNIIYDKIVDQITSWYLYLATNEVNHEEEMQIQAGIAELDKALSYFPSPRTAQDVLEDFEALGWKVAEDYVNFTLKKIKMDFGIFGQTSWYYYITFYNDKQTYRAIANSAFTTNGYELSMQEHKLLNELITIWGWI